MSKTELPKQSDPNRWKRLFDGSLNRLNGREVPASQQPICRVRRPLAGGEIDSKNAITTAAESLAALWRISTPRRQGV